MGISTTGLGCSARITPSEITIDHPMGVVHLSRAAAGVTITGDGVEATVDAFGTVRFSAWRSRAWRRALKAHGWLEP
jgi:hypothetical protein